MFDHWLKILLIGVVALSVCYLALIVLARRLPPGLLRDLVEFIPACVTTARVLRKDPRVPTRAKVALAVAVVWVISPIDLIPEFLPVIGPLDDIVVIALAIRYAARSVPREMLLEVWPAAPRLLLRLVGDRRAPTETPTETPTGEPTGQPGA
jgi:uncharacterized membrane protein YkvA (DUF1232 family)